jgi:C-terminal processing protease CtpA/Prc
MTLVTNASFNGADAYERSGLFLIKRGSNVVVLDARPGTPAASAGIVKGNTIDAIDGSPGSGMLLSEIRGLLTQPAGTVVKLQLTGKDGPQRSVQLTLRDYV